MSAGATSINTIKKEILTVLSKVTNLQKVYDFERLPPEGFPAAFVTLSDNENNFHTTSENMRVFAFDIRVLMQFGQKIGSDQNYDAMQNGERILGDTTSAILDALDDRWMLNGVADGGSAASPSAWQYIQWEGGWGKIATINLRVSVIHSVDVTSGG